MDKERQLYQLHQKGYEDISKAISDKATVSISIDGADAEKIEIESPKGDNGKDGENGKDGSTPVKGLDYFTPDEVESITKDILKSIPKPKDGENGKDAIVDYERINKFVKQEVAKIPKPKDGITPVIDYNSITKSVLEKIPAVDYPTIYEHVNKQVERAQSIMPRVLNSAGPTTRLEEISNITKEGLTAGKILQYDGTNWNPVTMSGGTGAVDSVNSQTGVVVLTTADIADSLNKRYVTDANLTTIGNQSGTNSGDNATNSTSNTYADGKVADAINDGTTTIAPSQNAVFDALALKSPIASPTFTGTVTTPALNVSGQTASTIAGFDASKNLVTLATATYPSLTELTYVKGVTSAIQTQINAKGAGTVTSVTSANTDATVATTTTTPVITIVSAPKLTTTRAIYGNNFDGSAALTQIIASTYGGTGNGFTKFTGPTTAEKTFTLPNASSTIVVQGGALGTPSSGTLTNATGLPIAGLVASTSTAIGVGSIELGAVSDTTIARVSAGVISVEGVTVPTISSTSTLTNKRVNPRTASSTTASTLTPDLSSANVYFRTTQTATLTINAPIGTPVIGETIAIYVDSAGAQTLTMDATYIPFGSAFPATTTAGKTLMITAQYNGTNWKTLWANAV